MKEWWRRFWHGDLDSVTVRFNKLMPPRPMQDLLARVQTKQKVAKPKPVPRLVKARKRKVE